MKRNGLLLIQHLVTLILILTSSASFAQESETFEETVTTTGNSTTTTRETETKTTKMKERRTTLDFEDELVEGSMQKPDMIYLFQQKNFNYRRLIKHRENFLPEMRKTTEDVQRIRSGG